MRLITGAPMWTRLSLLRAETRLPSLVHRIDQRNTAVILKTLKNDRNCPLKNKLQSCINRHEELDPPKNHAGNLLATLRRIGMQESAANLKKDTPCLAYQEPAPSTAPLITFNITTLPENKASCTPQQLLQAARDAINNTIALKHLLY